MDTMIRTEGIVSLKGPLITTNHTRNTIAPRMHQTLMSLIILHSYLGKLQLEAGVMGQKEKRNMLRKSRAILYFEKYAGLYGWEEHFQTMTI